MIVKNTSFILLSFAAEKGNPSILKMPNSSDKDLSSKASEENCNECAELQREFAKNPGGKPIKRKGLIVAAVVGKENKNILKLIL